MDVSCSELEEAAMMFWRKSNQPQRNVNTKRTSSLASRCRVSGPEPLETRDVPAILTVNTVVDSVNSLDNVLSLREAMQVVNGTRALAQLSAPEAAQITGAPLGVADKIQFSIGPVG